MLLGGVARLRKFRAVATELSYCRKIAGIQRFVLHKEDTFIHDCPKAFSAFLNLSLNYKMFQVMTLKRSSSP